MSVYTELSQHDIEQLLTKYTLGSYQHHQGISAGVENTNYFVTTSEHELVLTLFEKHQPDELPFFLKLGEHLHNHHCKVPQPFRDNTGEFLQTVKGKPAVFIERVSGGHVEATEAHANAIASALAEVHLATTGYADQRQHSHGEHWIQSHQSDVAALLEQQDRDLLDEAIRKINSIPATLPTGIIHADLFHDNALFDGDEITGIIDWYFAGFDNYALDIAIALNDWCLSPGGLFDPRRGQSFIEAYDKIRKLNELELKAIPYLQVQAACRFWMSRTLAKAEHIHANDNITVKDPNEMKTLLIALLHYTHR